MQHWERRTGEMTAQASLMKSKQRVADHGEVFTPDWLVQAMLDQIKDETERIDSRVLERGERLAARYRVSAVRELGERRPRLLINATPVGMAGGPEADQLAFGREVVAAADIVLDDVVYLPPDTPLVRLARGLGLRVLTGDEVMMRQSREQFAMYTGVVPTAEQIDRAEAYAAS